MPAMDGFEFCRAIKSDQRTSHIPVILLTAREDRDSLLKGLEEGADDYLTKPFDAAALRLRVRNILETRQMLRARLAAELDRTTGTASADGRLPRYSPAATRNSCGASRTTCRSTSPMPT